MLQPEINIEQGKLKGKTGQNLDGNNYYSFQGIPFAKPPTGNLRFKDPVAPEKWTGIFDATKEGDACYSIDMLIPDKTIGSENCLFLNVFTKQLNAAKPVMVFIHGGAFYQGSSSETYFSSVFLMIEDIVLVTFNYRLGLFGFLTLEEPTLEINGNAGMKDMIMALKWVQKNIAHFGGDPNNVTIFGESAGGSSVHALMLSPLAKGLFHKVIAQSGCALAPWTKGHNYSKEILNILDVNHNDQELLDNLRAKSASELIEIQKKIVNNLIPCELSPFGFVVDQNSENPFLPDEPINIILSGDYNHVPFMTGYTSSEGLLFEYIANLNNSGKTDTASNIPWELGYEYGSEASDAIATLIDQFYRDLEPNSKDNTISIKSKSDTMFVYPMYVTALKHVQTSKFPVYLYRVSIETELNIGKKMFNVKEPGVCHGDELGYLFKSDLLPVIKKDSLEELSIRRFVKLWTNFAKFGNPTPNVNEEVLGNIQWKSVQDQSFPILDIGKELRMLENPESEPISFWNGLHKHSPSKSKLILD